MDFVVILDAASIQKFINGFPESEFYLPPEETIAEEIARARGHFNVIHSVTGFKADFYAAGTDDLNAWGFQFQRAIQLDGEALVLAPPEYVIVRKLEYFAEGGSEKHIRDIRSMLAISGEQIDRAIVLQWAQRLGLETEWRQVSS